MDKSMDIDPLLMETDVPSTKGSSFSRKSSLYLRRLWVETCQELRHDLEFKRPKRWRHSAAGYFAWFLFAIWATGQLVLSLIFPLYLVDVRTWRDSFFWNYCAPDGSFSLEPTNPWKLQWAFQITLGFGSMNFTQAKIVDVAWDIVSPPSACDRIQG